MANRATDDGVQKIIETDDRVNTAPFIAAANVLTNRVAVKDTSGILDTAALLEIETWLAAHFYACRVHQDSEVEIGDAVSKFQVGEKGKNFLDTTQWGRNAMAIDFTGCLRSINSGGKTAMVWLGKAPSDQIDYVDRD